MATKTFKIGLSATDKQNMAQDILEQVEEMLFEEYDSTKTYNIGDYCVYSGALYRCKVDNTTGTWNSSNWDSATLQDLVDDVNDAVASVNGKANIIDLENGTLVVAKSLTAKQLENVSDESGSTQDAPFNFQATGTENNTTETPTAPIAKHLELRGNTVAWNQILKPSAVSGTQGDITITNNSDGTFSISSGTASSLVYFPLYFSTDKVEPIVGHKYILFTTAKNITGTTGFTIGSFGSYIANGENSIIFTVNSLSNTDTAFVRIANGTTITAQTFSVCVVDLTLLGKEYDSVLAFNRDYPLPYYSYNAGELKSASSGKLITIGCNAFDGEFKQGDPSGSQTEVVSSKNHIRVIAGQTYRLECENLPAKVNARLVRQYDANGTQLNSGEVGSLPQTINILPNCYYVILQFNASTGNTLTPSEITNCMFRLYWNESHDYVDYVKKEYDLPTVSLKSAGNAYDELKADGTMITRIGSVDLGTLDWNYDSSQERFYSGSLSSLIKIVSNTSDVGNIICAKYKESSLYDTLPTQGYNNLIATYNGNIYVRDTNAGTDAATFKTAMSGVYLYYELATPTETTDETKAFTENIEVDDFGTMEFVPASDNVESASNPIVPQGNQFFYPADYVLLIDDLNNYLNENEADTTDLVLRKELLPKLASNSEDGTYTLKATKSGSTITYAWVKDE